MGNDSPVSTVLLLRSMSSVLRKQELFRLLKGGFSQLVFAVVVKDSDGSITRFLRGSPSWLQIWSCGVWSLMVVLAGRKNQVILPSESSESTPFSLQSIFGSCQQPFDTHLCLGEGAQGTALLGLRLRDPTEIIAWEEWG